MRVVLRRAAFWVTVAGRGGTARRLVAAAAVSAAAIGLSLVTPGVALAATLTVTNCGSSGAGSLPDAVASASAGDTITFDPTLSCPPTSPIVLGSTLTIGENLTITGPGAATMAVSGGGAVEVFDITSGTVGISGLTIENGSSTSGGGIANNGGTLTVTDSSVLGNSTTGLDASGGGIFNNGGALTVTGSTVSGNSTAGKGGGGGGIATFGGTLTVTGSTISGNSVGDGQGGGIDILDGTVTVTGSTVAGNTTLSGGGGIFNQSGSVAVTSSTVAGNTAEFGGGIYIFNGGTVPLGTMTLTDSTVAGNTAGAGGGGIDNSGTVTLAGSTIAGNTAAGASGSDGGGIDNSGTVNAGGTIVAGNTSGGVDPNCAGSALASAGYNLTNDTTGADCGFTPPPSGTDVVNADPLLGSLGNHGGPTYTMVPGSGSPAVGAIPSDTTVTIGSTNVRLCPATDQRGYASAPSTACDSGAVQTQGSAPALTTTPDPAKVTLSTSTPPVNDTAVLSGGINPTGTITFTLVDPNGTVVYTDNVPVNGSGTYATTDASGDNPGGFTPTPPAGTWQWDASYSGDAANGPLSDTSDPAEQVTVVAKASPGITSASGGTGTALSDSATLTGGNDPGGTITFTLYDPASTVAYTDVVTVSGDGTYSTAAGNNPGGFQPTTAGTYQWVAAYSGDDSNNAAATSNGDEPQTVYGSGGFMSPLPKSTLQKSGSTIPVKFRLTTAAGQPISSSLAAALAAAGAVKVTLTGPGITSPRSVVCAWNTTSLLFQCNIKTPSGLLTGKTNPYQITVYENVGGGFVQAPGTANPETIYFK